MFDTLTELVLAFNTVVLLRCRLSFRTGLAPIEWWSSALVISHFLRFRDATETARKVDSRYM